MQKAEDDYRATIIVSSRSTASSNFTKRRTEGSTDASSRLTASSTIASTAGSKDPMADKGTVQTDLTLASDTDDAGVRMKDLEAAM